MAPDSWSEGHYDRKGLVEAFGPSHPYQDSEHKLYCSLSVAAEMNANIKGFKVDIVTFITFPFKSAVWPVRLNDLGERLWTNVNIIKW